MTIAFAKTYRLVRRGEAGLTCDEQGVALGPVAINGRAAAIVRSIVRRNASGST